MFVGNVRCVKKRDSTQNVILDVSPDAVLFLASVSFTC